MKYDTHLAAERQRQLQGLRAWLLKRRYMQPVHPLSIHTIGLHEHEVGEICGECARLSARDIQREN